MPIVLSSVINLCPVHPFSDFQHFLYVTGRKCLRIGRQLFKKKKESLLTLLICALLFQSSLFHFQPSLALPFLTTLQLPTTTSRHASTLLELLI